MKVKNKSCTKCLKSKPISAFNKKKKAKDGLEFWCRGCTTETSKRYRKANPAILASLKKNWKLNNSEREKRNNKGYHLTKYWSELSASEALVAYNSLLRSQRNKCKICKRDESEFKSRFHVDHCHTSLKIRGLLCFNCNVMLGNSLENVNTLINAIKYLKVKSSL